MDKLSKILLIPNTTKKISHEHITTLADAICAEGCAIGVLPEHGEVLSYLREKVHTLDSDAELSSYGMAVVLGGDGSIIDATHRLLGYNIPIIGINFGHLGFMAALEIGETAPIADLLRGEYYTDRRMMLDAVVYSENGEEMAEFTVLNDLVFSNGPIPRLVKFDVISDGVKIESCRADGIIIATPTGSTAYSLSAGGPVLDPTLDCICITPICPHSLDSRPIIVRGDSKIEILPQFSQNASVYLSADGQKNVRLAENDRIVIKRSTHTMELVRLRDRAFIQVLRAKLADY
ncbi:MAG: NAD(+)/NADH kinase [Clostridia bacterium]|nr:NAD(+)/NADH kinase [Clostridia bacterium]